MISSDLQVSSGPPAKVGFVRIGDGSCRNGCLADSTLTSLCSLFVNSERWYTMSLSQISLRPHDVCVSLQLVLTPKFSYRELARDVGLSLGEAHNSVKRLEQARLFLADPGSVNLPALSELLVHGIPYVFPGQLGPDTRGIPTAHSGPALAKRLSGADAIVWPSCEGDIRGHALVPLCASAPDFVRQNPELYRWLTLVDALRVGRARDRRLAEEILRGELERQAVHDD